MNPQKINTTNRAGGRTPAGIPSTSTSHRQTPQQIFAADLRQRANERLWLDPQLARALAKSERLAASNARRQAVPDGIVIRLLRWAALLIISLLLGVCLYAAAGHVRDAGKKAFHSYTSRLANEMTDE